MVVLVGGFVVVRFCFGVVVLGVVGLVRVFVLALLNL